MTRLNCESNCVPGVKMEKSQKIRRCCAETCVVGLVKRLDLMRLRRRSL